MIRVDSGKRKAIAPGMFGLFFEDINYALDGGLSAEMIENRSFEFYDAGGSKCNWYKKYDGLFAWSFKGGCSGEIAADKPLSRVNPHYLKLTCDGTDGYFTNRAYDGIYMKAGTGCSFTFYAECEEPETVTAAVFDSEGREAASGRTEVAGPWTQYSLTLRSDREIKGGEIRISLAGAGTVCFDMISMIPEDAVCGVFRRDLADTLRDMHPGFLRFPGGCVVEGNTLDNMYRWKLSVGPAKDRKANWNRWAVHRCDGHGPFSHYNQTLAIGYYEYFLLCEYIGAKALPVCNVGLACQYESNEMIQPEDSLFDGFVRDAVDLIEFANGPAETKWGGVRASMGHPEPFGLEFIGIGNEQWDTPESRFFERYRIFEKAIHEAFPDIKLIGSAGPDVRTARYESAWEMYHSEAASNPDFAYAVDEHYYMKPEWFLENNGFYDDYPRDVKVFAGEYAAHVGDESREMSRNCLRAAISEAAFMTGLERNCDAVVMASYAPLFARIGYVQWAPDMIWFDAANVYPTPSYYVQKLFCERTGEEELTVENDVNGVFASASESEKLRRSYLKLVNPSDKDITTPLKLGRSGNRIVTVLTGRPDDYNSPGEPYRTVPKEYLERFEDGADFTIPAMSLVVIEY